ncbi:hypothetical protein BC834DRAFT_74277 [Gloeopeniophorella convolvens]|nr:hypothetical protein BC834DRAFT_74277 [Gloeopeniophorella convolvens]
MKRNWQRDNEFGTQKSMFTSPAPLVFSHDLVHDIQAFHRDFIRLTCSNKCTNIFRRIEIVCAFSVSVLDTDRLLRRPALNTVVTFVGRSYRRRTGLQRIGKHHNISNAPGFGDEPAGLEDSVWTQCARGPSRASDTALARAATMIFSTFPGPLALQLRQWLRRVARRDCSDSLSP